SRRRHTRWPRDWSSDVCSSDLNHSVMLGQQRSRCAGAAERSFKVNIEDFVPDFVGQPLKIRQLYPVRYSGVVDQYVQPTELSSHLCHHPTDLVVASDVRLERGSFDA